MLRSLRKRPSTWRQMKDAWFSSIHLFCNFGKLQAQSDWYGSITDGLKNVILIKFERKSIVTIVELKAKQAPFFVVGVSCPHAVAYALFTIAFVPAIGKHIGLKFG